MSSRVEKIVVGVDGSDSSKQALRWAARQARLTGGELHAVHVWDVPSAYGYVPAIGTDWADAASKDLIDTVWAALDPADARRAHTDLVRGHAAEALLEVSADADLLVVGSRGHGGFAGLMLGSVSQYLVTHATCPVVVIH
jgi:nucleotide-binding universal stress UspA family protein